MATELPTAGCVLGLKLRIPAAELKEHLLARANYHAERAQEKRAVLPELEEVKDKLKRTGPAASVAQMNKLSPSNYRHDADNEVEALQADIEMHHNKSLAFAYQAAHLFDADYCLDRSDLVVLEVLR